jgi:hypothetical protein
MFDKLLCKGKPNIDLNRHARNFPISLRAYKAALRHKIFKFSKSQEICFGVKNER